MDNLKIKTEDSVLNTLGVAFPAMKMIAYVPGAFLKFGLRSLDKVGFRNLKTISLFYDQEVEIETGTNYLTITLSDKERGGSDE